MPQIDLTVDCPVHRSFRVEQLAGMFDVPLEEKLQESFSVELPEADGDWKIGAIVGPSGSGKSTIAREAYGKDLATGFKWPKQKAVLDGFPERLSIKEITHALTAVGFSSPPSWVKPYAVLSNGEKFRVDLARALLLDRPLVAVDEFTSVVDRTVGQIGSAAVAKAIRKGLIDRKFVAVTCHYDILKWLRPDWTLDMASGRLARGSLRRRPEIRLEVAPVHHSAWVLFRRHHYLSGSLHRASRAFCAFWGERPVAFSAWMVVGTTGRGGQRRPGDKSNRREHRTVVLPDFQGVGIGNRLSEFCASIWTGLGLSAFSTTSHPGMIHYRSQSDRWTRHRLGKAAPGVRPSERKSGKSAGSSARITGGFEYVGPAMARDQAEAMVAARAIPFGHPRGADSLDRAIARYPGATAGLLARLTAQSVGVVRGQLAGLVSSGEVVRAGAGRTGNPYAYYPRRKAETKGKSPGP